MLTCIARRSIWRKLVGGAEEGVEVNEIDASSGERNLRGVEVRVDHRRAVPTVLAAAVAAESVRARRRAETGRAGVPRSPRESPLRNH